MTTFSFCDDEDYNQPVLVAHLDWVLACLAVLPMQMWVFDLTDGAGRLLRFRSGHSAPPLRVQYHGPTGHMLLTAGMDVVQISQRAFP